MKFLYNTYRFFIYIPFAIIFSLIVILSALILSIFIGDSRARGFTRFFSDIALALIPIKIDIEGFENIQKNTSYVLVSNHRSNFDPFILSAVVKFDTIWVMKKELLSVPILGFFCKKLGNIAVDRSNKEQAIKSLNEAKKRLVKGTSVVFFPEGTRNSKPGLAAFKKGAFHFAVEMELPILAVTIIGIEKLHPNGKKFYYPATIKAVIHPPIDTTKFDSTNILELTEYTRNIVASRLTETPY